MPFSEEDPLSYRVTFKYERDVTFFVDAPSKEAVEQFIEENVDFEPGNVRGLIDHVTEEEEVGFLVEESPEIIANFELTESGIEEKE